MSQTNANVTEHLAGLCREWAEADVSRKQGVIKRILADDFKDINAIGKVHTKSDYLQRYTLPLPSITSNKLDDIQVKILDNTAVVTGISTVEGKDSDGNGFSGRNRWTDVFVNRSGEWQCVATHASHIESA